jgi:DNA repair protein RadD
VILRPYQQKSFDDVRNAFAAGNNRVFLSMPTGAGKTVVFSSMAESAYAKGRTTWICLPRKELLDQSSRTLSKIGVPHGRISAGRKESRAFSLHLVSSNTLIRRWDKIINPPDFIIMDEAHLYYDRQREICDRYPTAKIIGVSASPERLDGRGLSDIYDTLIEGPNVKELVEQGYLCHVDYYAPRLEGLSDLHRKGLDYDETELAALMARRKVYGKAVDHYRQHADGKTALVFARSVDEAEKIALEFRNHGYKFETVSAKTPSKLRSEILSALESGEINGVVNCEVATYGLDVPRIECVILLRPTLSKALSVQMIGRGLRTSHETGKEKCIILDHVNMIDEFGHPFQPYTWQFDGWEKRKRETDPSIRLKLCPETFMYCTRSSCVGCPNNTKERKSKAEHVVDVQLEKREAPVELKTRPLEEQAIFQDKIGVATLRAKEALSEGRIDSEALKELLALAKQIKRQPMWIYWKLTEGKLMANVPLLSEIARQEGYKTGWVYFARQKVAEKLKRRK